MIVSIVLVRAVVLYLRDATPPTALLFNVQQGTSNHARSDHEQKYSMQNVKERSESSESDPSGICTVQAIMYAQTKSQIPTTGPG